MDNCKFNIGDTLYFITNNYALLAGTVVNISKQGVMVTASKELSEFFNEANYPSFTENVYGVPHHVIKDGRAMTEEEAFQTLTLHKARNNLMYVPINTEVN